MNIKDLRTLRGQLWLTAGLFGGCLVLAGIIVSQRTWFESLVAEKYVASSNALSPAGRKVAAAFADGQIPDEDLHKLTLEDRRCLYEIWMQGDRGSAAFARAMVEADHDYFVRCAEQTVVCGNPSQRARALELMEISHSSAAQEALARLANWARRRNRTDWIQEIEQVRLRISG